VANRKQSKLSKEKLIGYRPMYEPWINQHEQGEEWTNSDPYRGSFTSQDRDRRIKHEGPIGGVGKSEE
jgi:hypothetical protein